MLGLGMLNGIGAYCYFDALQTIPVSLAILIYYTYPVFCVIIGWGWRKRRPCRNASLAAMLILIAVSLVATPETLRGVPASAILSCAIAPLVFAGHIQYLAKPAQHIPATGRIAWSSAGHLVILIPMMLLSPLSSCCHKASVDYMDCWEFQSLRQPFLSLCFWPA
ncbi:EamA family transporter [Aliamphritea spongicola]